MRTLAHTPEVLISSRWRQVELRVQGDERRRGAVDAGHDVALARDRDAARGLEVAPQMCAARPPADDVGDVIVTAQEALVIEVEGLAAAVRVQVGGQLDLDAGQLSSVAAHAADRERTPLQQREREAMIMRQRIAEEASTSSTAPAAKIPRCPAVG